MAFLEQFTDGQKELLVSIPYRAGLWVSTVDNEGGDTADFKELEMLEKIIDERARGMFESAFVHEVMIETCTRRNDWKTWAKTPEKVLKECEEAVAFLSGKLAQRDIDAYRHNIMHIAVAVARAFREFDVKAPFWVRLWTGCRLLLDRLVGNIRGEVYESESLLNISYAEDLALAKLSLSLGVGTKNDTLE